MTAQINDIVFHCEIDYSLAGIDGNGLFDLESHGIQPYSMFSACWRGYQAKYAVEDNQLVLIHVRVGFSAADEAAARTGRGPTLFGTRPCHDERRWGWDYTGLRQPVAFTGGLLLADQFIDELYVHMGFHPAWKYREVRELLFDGGRLTDDFNRAPEMERIRVRLSRQPLEPRISDGEAQVREWVERCFSLDYTSKRNA